MRQEGICKAIVVDNSEDGGKSVATMQDGLDALQGAGFDTVVLHPGHNLGFACGVAHGLEYLANRQQLYHILLINSDARLTTGSLDHMRHALKYADIVAPKIAQGNQSPSSPIAYYDQLLGLITHTPKVRPLPHASGCCLLIHQCRAQPPLFDQDFFFYGEDVMLGFDCQRDGVTVLECAKSVVAHATSSSAKNGSMFYEYHINRSHWLLAQKLACNPLERCLFLAARCITLPLRALVRSVRFRSFVAWKGLWAATADVLRGRCRSFTPPS